MEPTPLAYNRGKRVTIEVNGGKEVSCLDMLIPPFETSFTVPAPPAVRAVTPQRSSRTATNRPSKFGCHVLAGYVKEQPPLY